MYQYQWCTKEGYIQSLAVSAGCMTMHWNRLLSKWKKAGGKGERTTQIPEIVLLARNVKGLSEGRIPRDTIWAFVQL
jgi:hypothetical protein